MKVMVHRVVFHFLSFFFFFSFLFFAFNFTIYYSISLPSEFETRTRIFQPGSKLKSRGTQ